CQAGWCAPSRQSFMFGRYTVKKEQVSMAEHFKNNGHYSARVGKIYHMRVPGDIVAGTDGKDHPPSWNKKVNTKGAEAHTPGLYGLLNQNIFKRDMEDRQSTGTKYRMFVTVESDGDGSDQPDHQAATETIKLLRENKDKPFFIAMGLVRPHYPMVAPKKYFDMHPWQKVKLPELVEGDLEDIPKAAASGNHGAKNGISQFKDNQKKMWAGYYASIAFMDDQVGRVMAELDRLGLRDSTAVIFTSDHGYHLGEKELWEKSNLHEEVSRVPFIVSVPGKAKGRSKALVELVDMYPTLADLAGLPEGKHLHGKSLVPVLDDLGASVRDAAYTSHGKGHALRGERYTYMHYPEGEVLYDNEADPAQITNLARKPGHEKILEGFRKKLEVIREEAKK
ncbi:MAG: sulfatase, partial [Phaeodactylibacter sp.]|nr:sulfatase [Phaeodactylibacter sp.]